MQWQSNQDVPLPLPLKSPATNKLYDYLTALVLLFIALSHPNVDF
jgi:hypothetical protein